jgi:hypothetical protein
MKIRFLSGPNAGRVDHAPQSQETELLIKAGVVEIVTDTPKPLPVHFGIVLGVQNLNSSLQATCPTCKRTDYYVGRPDKETIARNFLPYLCAHFKGVEVPEHTRLAYLESWQPAPLMRGQNVVSKNTPDNAPHYEVVDGVILPMPKPKGWDAWKEAPPK